MTKASSIFTTRIFHLFLVAYLQISSNKLKIYYVHTLKIMHIKSIICQEFINVSIKFMDRNLS
jgi:hypothetical protein